MKYKLKKWYPGLPKEWKTGHIEETQKVRNYVMNSIEIANEAKFLHEIIDNPEFWEEVKEPLFVTEDSKSIYEGDSYYTVFFIEDVNDTFKVLGEWKAQKLDIFTSWSKDCKYFSSKEAAEKYVEENKPLYSKKQVINILKGFDKELNEYLASDEDYCEYIDKYKDEE